MIASVIKCIIMYSNQGLIEKEEINKINHKVDDDQHEAEDQNFKTIESQSSLDTLLNQFQNYLPRTDIIDLAQLSYSKYLKLKRYKDAAYYGQIVNTKRHGKGLMIHNNNHIFQGEWQCDFKYGKGYEEFSNGCVYHGCYVNGRPEGIGRYTWLNGECYEGQWMNSLKHGYGNWIGAKGDSYVGEWKYGKADGKGVHVWINGDIYEGQFKLSLKHGEGTQKYVSGDIYKGSFYKGKFHGYGQYFWVNGSFYKGSFRSGCRDGNGIWKKASGSSDRYEGQYSKDKKDGYGIYTWNNGNIYKGNYCKDSRQGYGEMFWIDGSYYKGAWRNNRQEGEAVLYTPQGGEVRAIFKNNVMEEIYQEKAIDIINEDKQFKESQNKSKSTLKSKRHMSATYRKYNPTSFSQRKQKKTIIKIRDHHQYRGYSSNAGRKKSQSGQLQTKEVFKDQKNQTIGGYIYVDSRQLTPIKEIKKQQIPRSIVYRPKFQKRSKAFSNSAGNQRSQTVRNSFLTNRINPKLSSVTPSSLRPFSTKHFGNL